jgi:hypothetical protein
LCAAGKRIEETRISFKARDARTRQRAQCQRASKVRVMADEAELLKAVVG